MKQEQIDDFINQIDSDEKFVQVLHELEQYAKDAYDATGYENYLRLSQTLNLAKGSL